MKIAFLASPKFALPTLNTLINSKRHEVVLVVTNKDKHQGRKKILTPTPVKTLALKNSIEVLEISKIEDSTLEILKSSQADCFITCAFGHILPKGLLDIPRYGVINIHGSLLPKYRGASPIQECIKNLDSKTGITFMKTIEKLDAGDIISQVSINIDPLKSTSGMLFDKLSQLAADNIENLLDSIENGDAKYIVQDESKATFTKIIKKTDGLINFNNSYEQILGFMNANNPWPGSYFYLNDSKYILHEIENSEFTFSDSSKPGDFHVDEINYKLNICIKNLASVNVLLLQKENSKKITARDYINAFKSKRGK